MRSILQAQPPPDRGCTPTAEWRRNPWRSVVALARASPAQMVQPLYLLLWRAYIRKCDGNHFPAPSRTPAQVPEKLL